VYSFVKGLGTYDMRTIEDSLPHPYDMRTIEDSLPHPLKIFGSKNVRYPH